MQSNQPDPTNPWPREMLIGVESCSGAIAFLIFVRAAWNLPIADLPPADPILRPGDSRRPENVTPDSLLTEWHAAWTRALDVYSGPLPPRVIDEETHGRLDAMSTEELLAYGDPRSSGVFASGIDLAAYAAWGWEGVMGPVRASFDEQPERRNLGELVPAWRAGLRTIVELPLAGHYARRISTTHLLLAARTRRDRLEYGRSLSLPVEPVR